MPNLRCVVVLPTFGVPYKLGSPMKTSDIDGRLAVFQKGVGGYIESIHKLHFKIQKSFLEHNNWFIANQLMKRNSTKIYVNENGMECVENTATIKRKYFLEESPHMMGNIVLDVTLKVLTDTEMKFGIHLPERHLDDEDGDDGTTATERERVSLTEATLLAAATRRRVVARERAAERAPVVERAPAAAECDEDPC